MSPTWDSDEPPVYAPLRASDWVRIVSRAVPIVVLFLFGFLILLVLRGLERIGASPRLGGGLVQAVSAMTLKLLGVTLDVSGAPASGQVALVANHSSWLDILVLNARQQASFVSKAEVARWPVIGIIARTAGTVFITRNRQDAERQRAAIEGYVGAGRRILFFPEGTSTDGQRVLAFKPTLFAAFFSEPLFSTVKIQPVSVRYRAPQAQETRFFGWWGDMDFGPHILQVLAHGRGGTVSLNFSTPLNVSDYADRKLLAQACEKAVRDTFNAAAP